MIFSSVSVWTIYGQLNEFIARFTRAQSEKVSIDWSSDDDKMR